jgi:hypothetical protein
MLTSPIGMSTSKENEFQAILVEIEKFKTKVLSL